MDELWFLSSVRSTHPSKNWMDVAGTKTIAPVPVVSLCGELVAFRFGPDCPSKSNFISQLFQLVLVGSGKQSSADRK